MNKGLECNFSKLKGEPPLDLFIKANNLEKKGKDIVRFEIGQPDFDTPNSIKDAAKKSLDDGFTSYVPTTGIPGLKAAIQDEIEETRDFRPTKNQIAVLPGSKPGLFFGLISAIQKGDEVIYQNPSYYTYDSIIGYAGARKKQIPLLEENGFRMVSDQLTENITKRTDLILINSPHNPTGSVLEEKDVKCLYELAEEKDAYILSDEIYSKILYDDFEHYSPAVYDQCKERTIIIDGFSKTYSMTGWRLGYMVAPEDIIHKIKLLLSDSIACTTSFVQKGGIEALNNSKEEVRRMVDKFSERRNALVKGINKKVPGMKCLSPGGAFYVYPNIRKTGMKSKELSEYLLKEAGVCLLPGTTFGDQGEGFLRLSYACSLDDIKKGIKRMKETMYECK